MFRLIVALMLLAVHGAASMAWDDHADPRTDEPISAATLGTVEVENFGNLRYCGVYSVVVAAKMLGKEADVIDFLDNKNVSSKRGSTIADISRMLDTCELTGQPFEDGTIGWLEFTNRPAILHIRGQLEKSSVNHWVVFAGSQNGKFRIVDAGRGEVDLTQAELLAIWDGVGITVSEGQAVPAFLSRIALLFDGNVQILIVLSVLIVAITGLSRPSMSRLGVALVVGLAATSLVGTNLFQHRHAAAIARSSSVIQGVSVDFIMASKYRENSADYTLVDARTEGQYKQSHLPEAKSLPVNASILDYIMFAREQKESGKTVVTYCNSDTCLWAEKVAKRLCSLGVETKVLNGGIARWN